MQIREPADERQLHGDCECKPCFLRMIFMNKQIFILLLAIALFSCSKKNDNEQDLNTYITVVNNTSNNLENVLIGYWDRHTAKSILLKELGDANANSASTVVEVSNEKVIKEVAVYFQQSGKWYLITPPFTLLRHTKNSFLVTDKTYFQEIETDNISYPR
jgi:hypothetical protein